MHRLYVRALHENPLGLPRRAAPRPLAKKPIQNVNKVIAVASGKGGVGKSTIAVNLAFALALRRNEEGRRLRVGILDLDIFGPSIPTLMGLQNSPEPSLTPTGAIIPIVNHALPAMSMGFLLSQTQTTGASADRESLLASNTDTPIVWRGLMVQKATQQLLFDVDWTVGNTRPALDILVVDMPPGTGDVPLTLGQLVVVDGAVIVSTPQDVALADVRKGVAMFKKLDIPITGTLLNLAHYICPSCSATHSLFGSPCAFRKTARRMGVRVLGELGLVTSVGEGADKGVPFMLECAKGDKGGRAWKDVMVGVAEAVSVSLR